MKLTIGEAREFVRARLDELAAQESDMLLNAIDDRNLDKTIDTLIEDAITYIHLAAPASMMEGPILTESDFPMGTLEIDKRVLDIDTALAQTEDEILRLISFQCGDSEIKLTSAFYEDTTEARMQLNRHIQGQPDSPVLVRMDDSPNYKPHFKYYTTEMVLDNSGLPLHFVLRYYARPKLLGGGGGEDPGGAAPTVSPSSIILAAGVDQKQVTVLSESAWRITSNIPDWITVSELNGVGDTIVTISSGEQRGASDLRCQLRFTNEDGSADLEITKRVQASVIGDDMLVVAGTALNNGTLTLPAVDVEQVSRLSVWASEGLAWTATLTDSTNFLVAPTSGLGAGREVWSSVTIRAKNENNTGIERTATVYFRAEGATPIAITLRQPTAMNVTPKNVSVSSEAGSHVFRIETETEWAITFLDDPATHPEGFRLSAYSGMGNANVTCTYPENRSVARLLGFQVAGGGTTIRVMLSQAAAQTESISVRPGSLGPYPASGDISSMVSVATITATSTWALDSSTLPGWATIQKVGDTLRVISVSENTSSNPEGRSKRIKLYLEATPSKYAEVEISQLAPDGDILLQDNEAPVGSVTVPSTGGRYQASLTASGAWHLTTAYSWIHITSATSGTGNATVTFRVDSGSAEDGSIVASLDGTGKKSTYDIFRLNPPADDPRIELTRYQNGFYNNVELSAEDQVAAFDVRCYGSASQAGIWRASTNETWIREEYNSWAGTGTGTGWFHADTNSGSQRTGEIIGSLYDSNNRVISTSTFYVIQAGGGTGPSLGAYFSPSSIDSEEQTVKLNIVASSNLIWSIDSISDGLDPMRVSGSGSSSVDVIVEEYSGSSERTLSLRVYNSSYQQEATVSITQRPPYAPTGHLSISPFGTLNVAHNVTSQSILVSSDVTWQAESDTAGVILSPSWGANNGTISATFGANTSTTESRTITITVSGGGIVKTLTIEQDPNTGTLSVSPMAVTLPSSGGSATVTVNQGGWTLSKSDSWIQTSVTSLTTFTISASANLGGPLEGTVTVKVGNQSCVVAVMQGASSQLMAYPDSVMLDSPSGSTEEVTVFASDMWEVDENSNIPFWLEYSYTAHAGSESGEKLRFTTIVANTNTAPRDPATIYLKLVGFSDADPIPVTVSQKGNEVFEISPEIDSRDGQGGTGTITVTSNTDWEIIQISNGIRIEEDNRSGSGNGYVEWWLDGNTSNTLRTLTVTFQTTDGNIIRTFTLTQNPGYISISPQGVRFAGNGGERSIWIESSLQWMRQSAPSWIDELDPEAGQATPPLEPIEVIVRAVENDSTASERNGQIVIKHKDATTSTFVAVSQAKATNETLEIDPEGEEVLPSSDGTSVQLDITSSTRWKLNLTESQGVTASKVTGNGDDTVTLTVPANQNFGSPTIRRKIYVTTNDEGKERLLSLIHPGDTHSINFRPDVDSLIFYEDTGVQGITIRADQDWTAVQSALWVGASVMSGTANTDVYVEFSPLFNLNRFQDGTYTITTEGGATRILHISTVPSVRPL